MSIGDNIRYLRKKANLTQKQLAEKTDLNEVTIRCYELGKYAPKTETLHKLCKALNCNINEILEEPFDVPDFSIDDLEEIAPGIMLPSSYPSEVKEMLRDRLESGLEYGRSKDSYYDILEKIDANCPITAGELHFLCNECIEYYYKKLNTEGQAAASLRISNLLHELELLAKVPEYIK